MRGALLQARVDYLRKTKVPPSCRVSYCAIVVTSFDTQYWKLVVLILVGRDATTTLQTVSQVHYDHSVVGWQ